MVSVLALLAAALGPCATKADACTRAYARTFVVADETGQRPLRILRYAGWQTQGAEVFEGPFLLCRGLGEGWRVAPGSFHPTFLRELARHGPRDLKAALRACPIRFRMIDKTCAPCTAGNTSCPCAERHISNWVFCDRG